MIVNIHLLESFFKDIIMLITEIVSIFIVILIGQYINQDNKKFMLTG